MAKYYVIAILSGMVSSAAQILLKKSSQRAVLEKKSWISEYLNPYVIIAYGMIFACMLAMVFAYRGLPYKAGPVLESLAYLYIMVLSRVFLSEAITPRRLIGNLIIVAGVILFNL